MSNKIKKFWQDFTKNRFELWYGLAVGALAMIPYGFKGLLIAPVFSVLWRLGGMYGHSIRVWGGSALIALPAVCNGLETRTVIGYGLVALFSSIGYGVPSPGDKKPSALGKFFWELTGKKQPQTDILTRGTLFLGFILAISLLK